MCLSIYTYLFQHDGFCYLYNSETNLFSSISEHLYAALYDGNFSIISQECLQQLILHKIIVKEEDLYNYYYKQRTVFLESSLDFSHLGLVLVPTSNCNFACSYCFEGKKQAKYMSEEVVNSLISFINENKKAETLSITWYGGEPLMAFNLIEKITNRIKTETKLKIREQSIVTNGYLITNKVIDFMRSNHFDSIQITLDGDEQTHNQSRFLKTTHHSTYQRIIENIDKLIKLLPKCHIKIRVNVDKRNQDDFINVFNKFQTLYKEYSNVDVYPGFIREETEDGNKMCYNSLCNTAAYSFYKNLSEKGINVNFFPFHKKKGCMTNRLSSYIIGSSGEIYKCWNDVNHPEKVIGSILEDKMQNTSLFYRYIYETSPFNSNQCKNCLVFPVCSGTCASYRYKNLFEQKNFDLCTIIKDPHILEDCLLRSINTQKRDGWKLYI